MKTLTIRNRQSKPAASTVKPGAWSSIAMNHSGTNDRGVIQGAQAS